MRLSELIAKLEDLKAEHGDIQCGIGPLDLGPRDIDTTSVVYSRDPIATMLTPEPPFVWIASRASTT